MSTTTECPVCGSTEPRYRVEADPPFDRCPGCYQNFPAAKGTKTPESVADKAEKAGKKSKGKGK